MASAARWRPPAFDALLGAVLAAAFLTAVRAGPQHSPGHVPTGADIAVAALVLLLVATRRRWPLPVLGVTTGFSIWGVAAAELPPVLHGTVLISAYTVATLKRRSVAWSAGGAAAVLLYAAGVAWSGAGWLAPENVGGFAWLGMAVAVGDTLRTRRAYVAAVEERARRAEESRDAEAARRVIEERLYIARELHDVVAHHIALINVQAGVAAHVLRTSPDQAEEALRHVRGAARTVLDELSTVLGVLRSSEEEPEHTAEPAPGLARLAQLLDTFAAAGLRVTHHRTGVPRAVPAAVDLAAYRIIQESLTNARKHGAGTADLRVEYSPGDLVVEVRNPAGEAAAAGTGHGIVGMRERAASVGGSLRAGAEPRGHFTVLAVLPTAARGER